MEYKQYDLFGNETEPPIPKKGRGKYKTMQEMYGIKKGFNCKTCKHLVRSYWNGKTYFKCDLWIMSSSEATDIRLKNTACNKWE